MDSFNDNQEKKDPASPMSDWEKEAYEWEQMKEGVFGKILAEDPHFFEKKRRRFPWFFILAGAGLLLAVLVFTWQDPSGPENELIVPETPTDPHTNHTNEIPIAAEIESGNPVHSESSIQDPGYNPIPISKQAFQGVVHEDLRTPESQDTDLSGPGLPGASPKQLAHITVADPDAGERPAVGKTEEMFSRQVIESLPGATILIQASGFPDLATECSVPSTEVPDTRPENDRSREFSSAAGLIASTTGYSGSSPAAALRNDHTSPWMGVALQAQANLFVHRRQFLYFGLSAQQGVQNIDIATERPVSVLKEHELLEVTHYLVGGRSLETYGDTILTGTEFNRLVQYNKIRSFELVAGWGIEIQAGKHYIRPFAGAVAGWLAYSSGRTVAANKSILAFGNDEPVYNRWQVKSQAGLDIGRRVAVHTSCYLRYQFDKQWNNASNEEGLTWRPSWHRLSLGVSMQL